MALSAEADSNQFSQNDSYGDDFAQPNSPLFKKLPPELRSIIYRHLLAGHVFHVQAFINKNYEYLFITKLWSYVKQLYQSTLQKVPVEKALFGLVKSCRHAYVETLRIIYEENTFEFADFTCFLAFQRANPTAKAFIEEPAPQIQRLKLLNATINTHSWFETDIRLLEGLRAVDVKFPVHRDEPYTCRPSRREFMRIFVYLCGVDLKYRVRIRADPDGQDVQGRMDEEFEAMLAALKEMIGQPKTECRPLRLLKPSERTERITALVERANQILVEENLGGVERPISLCNWDDTARYSVPPPNGL